MATLVIRRHCVAVMEISLDYTEVQGHKGQSQQKDMLVKLCRLAQLEKKTVVIHKRGEPDDFDDDTIVKRNTYLVVRRCNGITVRADGTEQ